VSPQAGQTGAGEVLAALKRFQAGLDEPYKMTPAGMWACSDAAEVWDLFELVDLTGYRHFCDLGSGDGRAVLLAALFTRATGIEADPGLVEVARGLGQELGLARADFICGDCRQADLAPYDLLFLYPDKPLDWLEARLPADWPGRLLIYGPYFQPTTLAHVRTLYAGKTMCGLWRR
jgi:SAM-dependent methyltransferase